MMIIKSTLGLALIALTVSLLPSLAFASNEYSPDYCAFGVSFPDEPHIEQKCEVVDSETKCFDEVSYTKVFSSMDASISVRVICNAIDAKIYNNYSAQVMEATLRAMTDKNVITTFDTSFSEDELYKQAGLVGEGEIGMTSTIYVAQLWIDAGSAMSLEAELIGDPSNEADTMFSDILKSVGFRVKLDPNVKPTTEPVSE